MLVVIIGAGFGNQRAVYVVATYLTIFLSRLINLNNALCQWRNDPAKEHVGHLFARQADPVAQLIAIAPTSGSCANAAFPAECATFGTNHMRWSQSVACLWCSHA